MIVDIQPRFATRMLHLSLALILCISLFLVTSTTAQAATLAELPGDWQTLANGDWETMATNPFGDWTWGNLTGAGSTFAPAGNAILFTGASGGDLQIWEHSVGSLDPNISRNTNGGTVTAGVIEWSPGEMSFGPTGGGAVARWTAPAAYPTINISGTWTENQNGGPTQVRISRNGTSLVSDTLVAVDSTSTFGFSFPSVSAGDLFDFAVVTGGHTALNLQIDDDTPALPPLPAPPTPPTPLVYQLLANPTITAAAPDAVGGALVGGDWAAGNVFTADLSGDTAPANGTPDHLDFINQETGSAAVNFGNTQSATEEYATTNAAAADGFIELDFGSDVTLGAWSFWDRAQPGDSVTDVSLTFSTDPTFDGSDTTQSFSVVHSAGVEAIQNALIIHPPQTVRYVRYDNVAGPGGYDGASEIRFYEPIPEPGSGVLVLLGLLSVLAVGLKRVRR
ncbi:MAG: hypothetical protein CMM47_02255 [Rhodospirillaceae bacterium]|nr:hypothetical protein [Rhodospirillaceae bacterium]